MKYNKQDLVKSPLNYIGGKFKLLPQLLIRFPNKINTLYDIFGGGGTISLNTKAQHVHYNDIVPYVGDLLNDLKKENINSALTKIHSVINKYNLSTTNTEGFNKLRNDYNNGEKSWEYFYMLVCHSFNYQFRYNNKQEYNSSFGINRSYYSQTTEKKLVEFMNKFHKLDIVFTSKDFREFDFSKVNLEYQ